MKHTSDGVHCVCMCIVHVYSMHAFMHVYTDALVYKCMHAWMYAYVSAYESMYVSKYVYEIKNVSNALVFPLLTTKM